ncbi:MAG: hypothetical protein IJH84_01975 [Saccharopolyspora sp.]|uniref:hypothetical protein n=1 Tax=Saccharopolyspora sp. TaxID=33915 RepID=UPI0025D45574|nr:hypothetical protein [Saccharopolyspora sp.]MBQ6639784.1 hypothetical protein [Saccharopolyspora sp.]
MLLVVLALVLAAAGVLVTSVVIGSPAWSWLSVVLCAVCAVLLVVDRLRRRREASSSPSGPGPAVPADDSREGTAAQSATAEDGSGDEPAEEDTDAADALLVSESDEEVVVVDERPRYHLAACGWLGDREVLSLPVREARELGFTSCARCTPDAVLAGQARTAG